MNTDTINPDDEQIQEMKIKDLKKLVEELQFVSFTRSSEMIDNTSEFEISDESDFYVKEQN